MTALALERFAFIGEIGEWHKFAEQALIAAESEPHNLALRDYFAEKAKVFPDGPNLVWQIWADAQEAEPRPKPKVEPPIWVRPLSPEPKPKPKPKPKPSINAVADVGPPNE